MGPFHAQRCPLNTSQNKISVGDYHISMTTPNKLINGPSPWVIGQFNEFKQDSPVNCLTPTKKWHPLKPCFVQYFQGILEAVTTEQVAGLEGAYSRTYSFNIELRK